MSITHTAPRKAAAMGTEGEKKPVIKEIKMKTNSTASYRFTEWAVFFRIARIRRNKTSISIQTMRNADAAKTRVITYILSSIAGSVNYCDSSVNDC